MIKKKVAEAAHLKDKLKHRLHSHAPPTSTSRHGSKYRSAGGSKQTAMSFSSVDNAAFEQILDDDSDIDFKVIGKAPPPRPPPAKRSTTGTSGSTGALDVEQQPSDLFDTGIFDDQMAYSDDEESPLTTSAGTGDSSSVDGSEVVVNYDPLSGQIVPQSASSSSSDGGSAGGGMDTGNETPPDEEAVEGDGNGTEGDHTALHSVNNSAEAYEVDKTEQEVEGEKSARRDEGEKAAKFNEEVEGVLPIEDETAYNLDRTELKLDETEGKNVRTGAEVRAGEEDETLGMPDHKLDEESDHIESVLSSDSASTLTQVLEPATAPQEPGSVESSQELPLSAAGDSMVAELGTANSVPQGGVDMPESPAGPMPSSVEKDARNLAQEAELPVKHEDGQDPEIDSTSAGSQEKRSLTGSLETQLEELLAPKSDRTPPVPRRGASIAPKSDHSPPVPRRGVSMSPQSDRSPPVPRRGVSMILKADHSPPVPRRGVSMAPRSDHTHWPDHSPPVPRKGVYREGVQVVVSRLGRSMLDPLDSTAHGRETSDTSEGEKTRASMNGGSRGLVVHDDHFTLPKNRSVSAPALPSPPLSRPSGQGKRNSSGKTPPPRPPISPRCQKRRIESASPLISHGSEGLKGKVVVKHVTPLGTARVVDTEAAKLEGRGVARNEEPHVSDDDNDDNELFPDDLRKVRELENSSEHLTPPRRTRPEPAKPPPPTHATHTSVEPPLPHTLPTHTRVEPIQHVLDDTLPKASESETPSKPQEESHKSEFSLPMSFHLLLSLTLYLYYSLNIFPYMAGFFAGFLMLYMFLGSVFIYYVQTIEKEMEERRQERKEAIKVSDDFVQTMKVDFSKLKDYQVSGWKGGREGVERVEGERRGILDVRKWALAALQHYRILIVTDLWSKDESLEVTRPQTHFLVGRLIRTMALVQNGVHLKNYDHFNSSSGAQSHFKHGSNICTRSCAVRHHCVHNYIETPLCVVCLPPQLLCCHCVLWLLLVQYSLSSIIIIV
jgi:hypothetical protein